MQIGRRIYYELATGNVIQDTGERSGSVVETTIEQDYEAYASLAERVPSTVGILQLEYGQYAQDFRECNGYAVDVSGADHSLVFSYPDPSDPEAPPAYQQPLSVIVAQLEAENADVWYELMLKDAIIQQHDTDIADLFYLTMTGGM